MKTNRKYLNKRSGEESLKEDYSDYDKALAQVDKEAEEMISRYDKGDESIFDILSDLGYVSDDPNSVYMYKEVGNGNAIVFDLEPFDDGKGYVKYFVVDDSDKIPSGYTSTRLFIDESLKEEIDNDEKEKLDFILSKYFYSLASYKLSKDGKYYLFFYKDYDDGKNHLAQRVPKNIFKKSLKDIDLYFNNSNESSDFLDRKYEKELNESLKEARFIDLEYRDGDVVFVGDANGYHGSFLIKGDFRNIPEELYHNIRRITKYGNLDKPYYKVEYKIDSNHLFEEDYRKFFDYITPILKNAGITIIDEDDLMNESLNESKNYKDLYFGEINFKLKNESDKQKVEQIMSSIFGDDELEGGKFSFRKTKSGYMLKYYGNIGSIYYEKYFKEFIKKMKNLGVQIQYKPESPSKYSKSTYIMSLDDEEKVKDFLNESLNEGSSSYIYDFEDFMGRVDEVSTEDELRELYDEVNSYGFNMSDLHYLTYLIFKKMKSLEESLNEDLFDKPRNIADSICKYLDSKNFYNYELVDYDAYPMNTSKITFEVDGDWKHDHWRFKDLVYDWSFDNNKSIYKMESELVRDDGSDSYASDYFIYVTENEDSLNALKSMSKLFSEDYKEESLREDLGLDPWYGKYVPIDIGGSKGIPRKVYFYFDSTDFDEAEEEFFDIIPEPYVKAKLYGRASEGSLVKDGWKNINESLNEGIKKDFKDKYLNLKRKIEDEASKNNSMVFFSDGEDILPAFRVKSRDKFYSTCMWNSLYNMIGTENGLRRYSDTEFGYEERLSKFRSSLYRNTYKKRAYSGDRVKSNESLNEASYGGAFDIEDDQFFTRDDINEFAWEVADSLSSEFGKIFDVSDSYMETPKRLHLEVTDGDYDYFADIDINMRRIRSPRDLMKYLNDAIDQIKSQMDEY